MHLCECTQLRAIFRLETAADSTSVSKNMVNQGQISDLKQKLRAGAFFYQNVANKGQISDLKLRLRAKAHLRRMWPTRLTFRTGTEDKEIL